MKRVKKSNPQLLKLIDTLLEASRKNDAPIWRDVANRLSKPARNWAEVNVGSIERYASPKEMIVIPGKLLGAGVLTKPVTVAAFSSSSSARKKVVEAGGSAITIEELIAKSPDGKGVRIMG